MRRVWIEMRKIWIIKHYADGSPSMRRVWIEIG